MVSSFIISFSDSAMMWWLNFKKILISTELLNISLSAKLCTNVQSHSQTIVRREAIVGANCKGWGVATVRLKRIEKRKSSGKQDGHVVVVSKYAERLSLSIVVYDVSPDPTGGNGLVRLGSG